MRLGLRKNFNMYKDESSCALRPRIDEALLGRRTNVHSSEYFSSNHKEIYALSQKGLKANIIESYNEWLALNHLKPDSTLAGNILIQLGHAINAGENLRYLIGDNSIGEMGDMNMDVDKDVGPINSHRNDDLGEARILLDM